VLIDISPLALNGYAKTGGNYGNIYYEKNQREERKNIFSRFAMEIVHRPGGKQSKEPLFLCQECAHLEPSIFESGICMSANLAAKNSNEEFMPYQRMANAIVEVMRKNGECLPQDLLPFGFTKDETIDHWHKAHAIAKAEWNLLEKIA